MNKTAVSTAISTLFFIIIVFLVLLLNIQEKVIEAKDGLIAQQDTIIAKERAWNDNLINTFMEYKKIQKSRH